jgi:hypothetical protein
MVVDVVVKAGAILTNLPRKWADWNLADEDVNYTVRDYDLAPDGRRVLALVPAGGPPWSEPRVGATLLGNFLDEVRRLSPVPR